MGYWTDLSYVRKCRTLSNNIRSIANQCDRKLEISASNYTAPEKVYLNTAINQVYHELCLISSELDNLATTILKEAQKLEVEREEAKGGNDYCK